MAEAHAASSRVFFLGSFPPPVGGQTLVNAELAQILGRAAALTLLDISPGILQRSLAYHLNRGRRCLLALWRFLLAARTGDALLISQDSGQGILYQLPLAGLARLRGVRLFIYHHSFEYLDERRPLIAAMATLCGRGAVHVFLCHRMRRLFEAAYLAGRQNRVVSNIVYFEEVTAAPERSAGPLTIGLIAHLSAEKGVDIFLDLLRTAATRDLPIRGRLAGPFKFAGDRERYGREIAELGARVDYLGQVEGPAKEAFFRSIDVLVLPSRFKVEAQPLIIFEALCRGIPVIAYGRGCVAEDAGGSVTVIPVGTDFIAPALDVLEGWVARPTTLAEARTAAHAHFRELRARAGDQLAALVARLKSPVSMPGGMIRDSQAYDDARTI